jgi:hypothetical protein
MSPADRSVQFNVPLRSSPREPPDFPSLPAGLLTFGDRPADHRSSFATLHSARLFREPLGTKAIMPWNSFSVKQKICVKNPFPQQFSCVISCA